MRGLQLALVHPEIPSCADCARWVHDPKTWKQSTRGGRPVARPAAAPPPCYLCPKSDADRPSPENELSARNWRTLELYYQAKAGLPVPEDPIVRRNFGLIAWTLADVARRQGNVLSLYPLLASRRN